MIKEFFWTKAVQAFGSHGDGRCQLVVAWGGLLVIVAHACVHGWIKYRVNEWYRDFYDLLAGAGTLGGNVSTTEQEWEAQQSALLRSLMEFVNIAIVSVVVMPIAKFFRSAWALQWRLALMRAYVSIWNANRPSIEGASQRTHEDSYKFSRGVELCLTTILDAVETLCPNSMRALAWLGSSWLVGLAVSSALLGFVVTMTLGHKLVRLEVENQVVEAKLRRDLVILETSPVQICHVHCPMPTEQYVDVDTFGGPQSLMPPLPHFLPIFEGIQRNYTRLFLNFGVLNLWLTLFDQFNTILPYLVFAPLLFDVDPRQRIQLGTLVQVSNSFDKVFGSLSIVAENWSGGRCLMHVPLLTFTKYCHSRCVQTFCHSERIPVRPAAPPPIRTQPLLRHPAPVPTEHGELVQAPDEDQDERACAVRASGRDADGGCARKHEHDKRGFGRSGLRGGRPRRGRLRIPVAGLIAGPIRALCVGRTFVSRCST